MLIYEGLVPLLTFHGKLNSLAPGKFECNFIYVIFKQLLVSDCWGISCEIALMWMSLYFTDDQPTLVQVMAWCRQATIHYLSQCWPRSLSPYSVTRPQRVKSWCQFKFKFFIVSTTSYLKTWGYYDRIETHSPHRRGHPHACYGLSTPGNKA